MPNIEQKTMQDLIYYQYAALRERLEPFDPDKSGLRAGSRAVENPCLLLGFISEGRRHSADDGKAFDKARFTKKICRVRQAEQKQRSPA